MGGMIAQALAVLHPRQVSKIVLAATQPGTGHADPTPPGGGRTGPLQTGRRRLEADPLARCLSRTCRVVCRPSSGSFVEQEPLKFTEPRRNSCCRLSSRPQTAGQKTTGTVSLEDGGWESRAVRDELDRSTADS